MRLRTRRFPTVGLDQVNWCGSKRGAILDLCFTDVGIHIERCSSLVVEDGYHSVLRF